MSIRITHPTLQALQIRPSTFAEEFEDWYGIYLTILSELDDISLNQ